jgi:hypothetical protein
MAGELNAVFAAGRGSAGLAEKRHRAHRVGVVDLAGGLGNQEGGTMSEEKSGWWRVYGLRHAAIVKATSAEDAIAKADGIVDEWEDPVAHYIGEELPEVFTL